MEDKTVSLWMLMFAAAMFWAHAQGSDSQPSSALKAEKLKTGDVLRIRYGSATQVGGQPFEWKMGSPVARTLSIAPNGERTLTLTSGEIRVIYDRDHNQIYAAVSGVLPEKARGKRMVQGVRPGMTWEFSTEHSDGRCTSKSTHTATAKEGGDAEVVINNVPVRVSTIRVDFSGPAENNCANQTGKSTGWTVYSPDLDEVLQSQYTLFFGSFVYFGVRSELVSIERR